MLAYSSESAQPIVVETTRFPLITVTYPPQFSDETWSRAITKTSAVIERGIPCAFVLDASRLTSIPTPTQRQAAARMTDRYGGAEHIKAWAIVSNSTLVRGAVTAVLWLSKPQWPVQIFSSVSEAERWARRELER